MKKVVNKWKFAVILSLIVVPSMAWAQDFPPEVEDVPFDGGVSLLVAAGIGYGLKKVHDRKKEAKNNANIEK